MPRQRGGAARVWAGWGLDDFLKIRILLHQTGQGSFVFCVPDEIEYLFYIGSEYAGICQLSNFYQIDCIVGDMPAQFGGDIGEGKDVMQASWAVPFFCSGVEDEGYYGVEPAVFPEAVEKFPRRQAGALFFYFLADSYGLFLVIPRIV